MSVRSWLHRLAVGLFVLAPTLGVGSFVAGGLEAEAAGQDATALWIGGVVALVIAAVSAVIWWYTREAEGRPRLTPIPHVQLRPFPGQRWGYVAQLRFKNAPENSMPESVAERVAPYIEYWRDGVPVTVPRRRVHWSAIRLDYPQTDRAPETYEFADFEPNGASHQIEIAFRHDDTQPDEIETPPQLEGDMSISAIRVPLGERLLVMVQLLGMRVPRDSVWWFEVWRKGPDTDELCMERVEAPRVGANRRSAVRTSVGRP